MLPERVTMLSEHYGSILHSQTRVNAVHIADLSVRALASLLTDCAGA
jgi:hypothetical protein